MPSPPRCDPATDPRSASPDATSGLAQGGLGGDDAELLEAGQEEVFARSEVEQGVIEHHKGEDAGLIGERPKGG